MNVSLPPNSVVPNRAAYIASMAEVKKHVELAHVQANERVFENEVARALAAVANALCAQVHMEYLEALKRMPSV